MPYTWNGTPHQDLQGRGDYNPTIAQPWQQRLLHTVNRSLIVPYSALEMYALVNDVDRYHEFLPWCNESETLEQEDEVSVARISIAFKGLNTAFTTRNRLVPGRSIHMKLCEGPSFKTLIGDWQFVPLDDCACRIELSVQFILAGRIAEKALTPIFSRICADLVDAFAGRAKALYGERAFA